MNNSSDKTILWTSFHISFFLAVICLLLSLLLGALTYILISFDIPDSASLSHYQPPLTTIILDKNGETTERIFRQNRFIVSIEDTPGQLSKAFVAAEDGRFYEHSGVDVWSIIRAFFHNIKAGRRSHGGSTITQQVARSLLLSPEKTYSRKIREAILAYRIDKLLSKEEILHIYLNQIYLGEGAYGVEAAARTYFDKKSKDLNLAEISLLAGLPQAPSRYSPFKNYKSAKKRQAYVLNRMAEMDFISPEEARKAFRFSILLHPREKKMPENDYFTQNIKKYIEQKYGKDTLLTGGLTIYTTLDKQLQKAANQAIKKGLKEWAIRQNLTSTSPKDYPQAALVAMEVKSGEVRAIIGGTDFNASQFNRATQAMRQPGSAFKPIIYAAALTKGMTPATLIIDEPLRLQGGSAGEFWEPRNFDSTFWGPTTLRDGLVYSRNIVTIKILQETGINTVLRLAEKLGIQSPLAPNLSLALGSSDVSLLDITAAYATFARGGTYIEPQFITKIVDRNGMILEQQDSKPLRVLDELTAYQVTHLLKEAVQYGTGGKAKGLKVATAGKTGTTDKNMDAWFVGFTPTLTAGVWVGQDRMAPLGANETGGRAAAPIWLAFMQKAHKNSNPEDFYLPEGITLMQMNHKTGEIVIQESENTTWEAFRNDNLPEVFEKDLDGEDPDTYRQH